MAIKPQLFFFTMNENYTTYYKIIGEKIKKKRKEKGLTQQQVAEKISKFDRSKISDIENGKEDFLFSTLLKICDALDISLKELID